MNRKIASLIPTAVDVLSSAFPKEEIPKVYKAYISSLGAALRMSGLLPTLAFYHKDSNLDAADRRADEDRSNVTAWIYSVLKSKIDLDGAHQSLFHYAVALQKAKNALKLKELEQDIKDASVALKLSIRTFKLV
jgi:CRISPR/Cas system CMR-associated protein Cmr5 small subunit